MDPSVLGEIGHIFLCFLFSAFVFRLLNYLSRFKRGLLACEVDEESERRKESKQ